MKASRLQILVLVISQMLGAAAIAKPAQIALIRHAEKISDTDIHLSTKGWKRAKALPRLFLENPELLKHGPPAALFAMGQKHADSSLRAIETLKYLSESLHHKINDDFEKNEEDKLVKQILKDASLDGKLVVICWEHKKLRDLAKSLGAHDVPKWSDERFDRVWLITNPDSNGTTLVDLPQKLLPDDSN